ncbi:hypothetical protein TRFO_16740 [Tritrichomonas foetus]|uniref:Uncharacterized protein n=1 Tax=Tritrichomonas foetus TaxID=1144522 RepID=A0A1J4KPL9_9EUKA|nr:hypothetical protein TRFO_16740 [Tritrichomonas foetus]|eukprot:OHT13187.1 hypothetical protein TRFO_16740 [Tritrichomonas foetus]
MRKSQTQGNSHKDENQNPSISYEDVLSELTQLGAPMFPRPSPNNIWKSKEDIFQLLKVIEVLTARRRQIDIDASEQREKRIQPLISRNKVGQTMLEEIQAKSKAVSADLEKYKKNLELTKQRRVEQREEQEQELEDIERKIEELKNSELMYRNKYSDTSSERSYNSSPSQNENTHLSLRQSKNSNTNLNIPKPSFDDENDKERLNRHIKAKINEIRNDGCGMKLRKVTSTPTFAKQEKKPKNTNLLNEKTALTTSRKSFLTQNYEDVQKQRFAAFQAQKARDASVSRGKNPNNNRLAAVDKLRRQKKNDENKEVPENINTNVTSQILASKPKKKEMPMKLKPTNVFVSSNTGETKQTKNIQLEESSNIQLSETITTDQPKVLRSRIPMRVRPDPI